MYKTYVDGNTVHVLARHWSFKLRPEVQVQMGGFAIRSRGPSPCPPVTLPVLITKAATWHLLLDSWSPLPSQAIRPSQKRTHVI
jgi:chaperone required for assembly of F1-ATPase